MERTTVGDKTTGQPAISVAATNSASTSGRIDMRGWAFGMVKAPTSITEIAWYHATNLTDTPTAIRKSSGTAVSSTTTAGDWTNIPVECAAAIYLVPILTGAASGTVEYCLKG